MSRPFRQQVDEEILDRAAGLFARHGFEHTSVQAVADAVGLSKAGLLHHYPTKDALYQAARTLTAAYAERVHQQVADLPPGLERDRRAVEALTDFALTRPGLVALMLSTVTTLGAGDADKPLDDGTHVSLFAAFALTEASWPERAMRVIGALAALSVLALAATHVDQAAAWRPHIVTTCLDALGHHRPSARSPRPVQVEA